MRPVYFISTMHPSYVRRAKKRELINEIDYYARQQRLAISRQKIQEQTIETLRSIVRGKTPITILIHESKTNPPKPPQKKNPPENLWWMRY